MGGGLNLNHGSISDGVSQDHVCSSSKNHKAPDPVTQLHHLHLDPDSVQVPRGGDLANPKYDPAAGGPVCLTLYLLPQGSPRCLWSPDKPLAERLDGDPHSAGGGISRCRSRTSWCTPRLHHGRDQSKLAGLLDLNNAILQSEEIQSHEAGEGGVCHPYARLSNSDSMHIEDVEAVQKLQDAPRGPAGLRGGPAHRGPAAGR
ncbi:hypothetical protein DPEC_G00368150 [Dallia pectoralis]|nr:hypothetical protein DPEC_G00368150 [Dallia pectoralis]